MLSKGKKKAAAQNATTGRLPEREVATRKTSRWVAGVTRQKQTVKIIKQINFKEAPRGG